MSEFAFERAEAVRRRLLHEDRSRRFVLRGLAVLLLASASRIESAIAGDDLPVLSRAEWGAKPPSMAMAANTPMRLTIHHTATRLDLTKTLAAKLRSLQSFSQSNARLADGRLKRPWADVPYHFYIDATGQIGVGRDVRYVGDTNTDYDVTGHIGIAVEGNFEVETPMPAQVQALEDLLVFLARTYDLPARSVGSHRDYARTACPGAHLLALIPEIKADVARRLQMRT
jgi:N-acetylmuramoyl-L-alanine amidase